MSEEYDYTVTPPPTTPERATHELTGYREQTTIINAAFIPMIYEISKKESPLQDNDPVAYGRKDRWTTLNQAQRSDVIEQSPAKAVWLLNINELPLADSVEGWKPDDMTHMLKVDTSIFTREPRIFATVQDAFQQDAYQGNPQFQTFLEQHTVRTRFRDHARFEDELDRARGEAKERLIFAEVWNTIRKMTELDPYDAVLVYRRKWDEMDPFGKYDVLREVELQATTCKIEFSANPTENLLEDRSSLNELSDNTD